MQAESLPVSRQDVRAARDEVEEEYAVENVAARCDLAKKSLADAPGIVAPRLTHVGMVPQ